MQSQCIVKHPRRAHATRVNRSTREAHATRNQQGTRPAHLRPTECGGWQRQHVEEQGTWASHTQKHREAGCGRPEDGGVWTARTVKRPPQQPAQPQYANYWAPLRANGTSCHIQHSPSTPTTGLRECGNNTSRSTGCSGQQKAATRRNMPREERVTVQGPVKKQQPDGMSHRGMVSQVVVPTIWTVGTKEAVMLRTRHMVRRMCLKVCVGGAKPRGTPEARLRAALPYPVARAMVWGPRACCCCVPHCSGEFQVELRKCSAKGEHSGTFGSQRPVHRKPMQCAFGIDDFL